MNPVRVSWAKTECQHDRPYATVNYIGQKCSNCRCEPTTALFSVLFLAQYTNEDGGVKFEYTNLLNGFCKRCLDAFRNRFDSVKMIYDFTDDPEVVNQFLSNYAPRLCERCAKKKGADVRLDPSSVDEKT